MVRSVALDDDDESAGAPIDDEPLPDIASLRDLLYPALAIALDDAPLAVEATQHALARAHRRGAASADAAEATYLDGFRWATEDRWPRTPPEFVGPTVLVDEPVDAATHDTRRPVALDPLHALAQLPIRQRSALVAELRLGWDQQRSARAHACPRSTVDLRLRRAWGELEKLTGIDRSELEGHVREIIDRVADSQTPPESLAAAEIAGVARRRTVRNRLLAAAAGVALIAAIGGTIRALPDDAPIEETAVDTVDPPRASQPPHAPIGDGAGGFVALEEGAYELNVSPDGIDWFAESHLNVSRIDLRLSVERFFRSGDRYLALVESSTGGGRSLTGSDQPRIAIADDVERWRLVRIEPDALPDIRGVRSRLDLLNAAAAGDRVLVAAQVAHEIDYVGQRVAFVEVCTVANDDRGLVLHHCDGDRTVLADAADRRREGLADAYRLFRTDGRGGAVELPVAPDFNPYGLLSFDDRFAMLDESTRTLSVSDDGITWEPLFDLGIDNRLGLVAAGGDAALAIAPNPGGWVSHLIRDGQVVRGRLPIEADPTTIWIKPEIAHGPAGWAMFLTTSRPWERGAEAVFGWAIHTGDWIVEQKAGEGTIRLRSTATDASYEYQNLVDSLGDPVPHPHLDRGLFGGVRLRDPATGAVLVTVTGRDIRDSWVTGEDIAEPPSGVVEIGGFRIEGNLRTGPLQLTDGDGRSIATWTDGFDFTNGDVTDGVETDRFERGADATVTFFDDRGGAIVAVPFAALEPLDLPPVERDPSRIKATVAYSPDGITWDIVWQSTSDTWYGSVAVGDDELLVSASGIVADPERIPVGE